MSKIKLFSKAIPIVLIVSILFTACDVPDISEFTKTSAEMTRGIRQGIKDTGDVLKAASLRKDLFLPETTDAFKAHSGNYTKIMEPTVETLKALDDYLDMLNALAQANRKSEENAKAAVGAVSSLITTASKLAIFAPSATGDAFALPDKVVQIATGLLSLGEQFRTAKSFKDRVNLSARIVEGEYIGEGTELKKRCTQESKKGIQNASVALANAIERIQNHPDYSPARKAELIKSEEESANIKVFRLGCGIIDLLKFTIQDLKAINTEILGLTLANTAEDNRVILKLKENIDKNNIRVRKGLNFGLKHTDLIGSINELENLIATKPAVTNEEKAVLSKRKETLFTLKRTVRENLEEMFILDGRLRLAVLVEIDKCELNNTCSGMRSFVNFQRGPGEKPKDFINRFNALLKDIGKDKFATGNSYIEPVLETRETALIERNKKYQAEEARLKPDYTAVTDEIKAINEKQARMDALFDQSISALNTWAVTHANLRATLNTKKPFSFAAFVSQVKALLAIIEPKEG